MRWRRRSSTARSSLTPPVKQQGQCPCTPDCAPWARRAHGRHASWPRFYRRSAEGLAARGFVRAEALQSALHGIAMQGPSDAQVGRRSDNACQRALRFSISSWYFLPAQCAGKFWMKHIWQKTAAGFDSSAGSQAALTAPNPRAARPVAERR